MDSDRFALNLMIVFGSLIVGGLMLAGLIWPDKPTFLYALGSAVSIWFCSFAVMFDRKGVYLLLLVIAIGLVGASVTAFVR
ncbi:hypothetical protein GTW25_16155 [Aliihoeflea aestuarii]|jgi:hypothetical protein|uniref:hypothetical protein n=1 Tax=Aliihoeflea aestuarii TaxID=453840 RepID=UPI002094273F|nr:hypothetical protein [Aliihoeflea aestuarii]MCO6392559.1 hypothetical protein [Aliihoeflea aestuarii]